VYAVTSRCTGSVIWHCKPRAPPKLRWLTIHPEQAHTVFDSLLLILAIMAFAGWFLSAAEMLLYGRSIASLRDLPADGHELPTVSVVVAARNEARTIAPALRSLLELDYPDLEILVVNDRSTDGTGEILDREAALRPDRLRVFHLSTLPPGWLGKNHALHVAAGEARGDWLLFTDADVVFHPLALKRAAGYSIEQRLDHLAIAPSLRMKGVMLDLFAGAFALLFSQFARPWLASRPGSRFHIGIGAFNLVRADAYRAVGGHHPISMRPDDDLRLGRILKQNGFRQTMAFGNGDVAVEWYSSVAEATRGLEKNSFAAFDYSLPRALGGSLLLFLVGVFPFAALFFTSGPTFWLNALTSALVVLLYAGSTRASGSQILLSPAFPLAALLVLFIIARATALTLINDGISWRDTHYSLDELKKGASHQGSGGG